MHLSFAQFLLHHANSAFFVALVAMLAMAIVELISSLAGASISEVIDSALPDIDLDIDVDSAVDTPILALDWLNFGRVPFLVLIVLFLTDYSLSGYLIQLLWNILFSSLIPLLPAALLALVPAVLLTHAFGRVIGRILPSTLSTAVDAKSLEGCIAKITIGTARPNSPAEAKTSDRFGNPHYVRVVPADPGKEYAAGTQVVLIELEQGVFSCQELNLREIISSDKNNKQE